MTTLLTPRLRLEPWADAHLDGLHALNSDPVVMRYITGKPETREETQAAIERIKARWLEFGFSWWSFFSLETGEIVGAGAIQHLGRDPANPLEIGWRLRQDCWGQGYASEAAQAMATFAFDQVGAPLLCAVCQIENGASARVMERLGMQYQGVGRWYDMDCKRYDMTAAQWRALHSGVNT